MKPTHSVDIRFTTNFLAGGVRVKGIRRLELDSQHRILLPEDQIKKATEVITGVEVEPYIRCAPCSLLTRTYNRVRVDKFEGIKWGSKVTVFAEGESKAIHEFFNHLGKLGISQWGTKFNCGRFDVLTVNTL